MDDHTTWCSHYVPPYRIVALKQHSKDDYDIEEKDYVRRIDNVERQPIEDDDTVVDYTVVDTQQQENIVTAEMNVDDDSVIDLD